MDESEVSFIVRLKTSDVNDVLNDKRRKVIECKLELEFGDDKVSVAVATVKEDGWIRWPNG